MIAFNLWGALFAVVAFFVGAAVSEVGAQLGASLPRPAEPISTGVAAVVCDLALRIKKKDGSWRGTHYRNVLSDLFDIDLGGMLMILPIWFWGLVAILVGIFG